MTDATQAEKREVLRNTYHSRAIGDADDAAGGRFAAINKSEVTGSSHALKYPSAAGPWADSVRVPDEPPLGLCVDDLEPVGESFEVERSLVSLGERAAPPDYSLTGVERPHPPQPEEECWARLRSG